MFEVAKLGSGRHVMENAPEQEKKNYIRKTAKSNIYNNERNYLWLQGT